MKAGKKSTYRETGQLRERQTVLTRVVDVSKDLILLTAGALLFSLAHPSFLSDWGWFPLGFVALVPVFIVVHRASWKAVPLYGTFFGFVSYAIFNYWLTTFHPLAILIVPVIYAVYFTLLFPVLKLGDTLFPKYGYLVQLIIWVAYEYLRSLGFLGYPYGIMGYTQYLFLPFIQIASVTGIWGVTLLVVFPSVYLGHAFKNGVSGARLFFKEQRPAVIVYAVIMAMNLIYGAVVMRDYSQEKEWNVALIQHNADTWEGGFVTYTNNFRAMSRLSEEALAEKPETDIVIWSETAFVPGVDWHSRYRTDARMYSLVQDFKDFMATQNVPYVTGNSDGQLKDPSKPPVLSDGTYNRYDYNATLMYHQGGLQTIYRKVHLVPFTEHFPYEHIFPRFHRLLLERDYNFWEEGQEYTVFEADGVKFFTPICFEDVFGYLSRRFVNEGADVIVNLSNDSWSGSVAAQMQHMSMAIFRSVENRRSMVRSTNSGMTCTIDPDGRILDILEPFKEDYLLGAVPIYTERTTVYTQFGDYVAYGALIVSALLLMWGAGTKLITRKRKKRNGDNS